MNKLLNGFNNGRDTSDGVGGKSFQEINGNSSIKTKQMNKYIVVNAETIQKRIEELEKSNILKQWRKDNETRNGHSSQQREAKEKIDLELNTLKQILSNSKLLEEELKKAFSAGMSYGIEQALDVYEKTSPEPDLNTYISNINLDI